MKNYYNILGVDKTATKEEIKKTFKKLSKLHHPDKGGDEEKFKEINEAYSVLSDDAKRRQYDNPSPFSGFGDDPNDIINRMRERFRQGFNTEQTFRINPNIDTVLNITFMESYLGCEKEIKYKSANLCGDCHGSGGKNPKECGHCHGTGYKTIMQGNMMMQTTCDHCGGSGQVYESHCDTCEGKGYELTDKVVKIKIPPSILNGEQLQVRGYGNKVQDGQFGNLRIQIRVNDHPVYHRHPNNINDVVMRLGISYPEMVLGCEKNVDTLSGSKIKVKIPEYSKEGKTLRVKGHGFKVRQSNGDILDAKGDLLIILSLDYPDNISEKEKDLLSELKNIQ